MPRTKAFDEAAVLGKARDLFWERGYTATSIGDLEKGLGISRSSLYQTFGGKRELYDRTLATYQHDSQTKLRLRLENAADLHATLTDLYVETARQQHPDCQSKARGCYIVNATTEMANSCANALQFVAQNREHLVNIFTDALARAQVQGQLDEQTDTAGWANYLFVMYNGLQVVVQTAIDREELVRVVRRSIDALPWVGVSNKDLGVSSCQAWVPGASS